MLREQDGVSTAGCLITMVRQRWEMPVYRSRESGFLLTAMPGAVQSNVSPELRGRLDCPRTRLHGRPQSRHLSQGVRRSACRTRWSRESCLQDERGEPCHPLRSLLASWMGGQRLYCPAVVIFQSLEFPVDPLIAAVGGSYGSMPVQGIRRE